MLCLFCAVAVQGYVAETLWMQVVWFSELLILGTHLFVRLGQSRPTVSKA